MSEFSHIQRLIAEEEAKAATICRAEQDELVAALKGLVSRVQLAIKAGKLEQSFAAQCIADAQRVLAKIGGDA